MSNYRYFQDRDTPQAVSRLQKKTMDGEAWNYDKNAWIEYRWAYEESHDPANYREISEETANEVIQSYMR